MKTMKALTMQIGIFGKTNVGKSSIINLITNQNTSIVSEIPGTTTDLVYKQMELNPIGPITLIDTAGMDDNSKLAQKRIEKTNMVLENCDIAILVISSDFEESEIDLLNRIKKLQTPVIIVVNKTDLQIIPKEKINEIKKYCKHIVFASAKNFDKRDEFLNQLKTILLKIIPQDFFDKFNVLKDLINKNDNVLLVVPLDSSAPKGRLIMPQVQTIRNVLDIGGYLTVSKNTEYKNALKNLKNNPKIVICDSQVAKDIVKDTPKNILLTTFSTLFSANKADIIKMAQGVAKINNLKDKDKVLIAETCNHHATCEDIGRVKIPNKLKEYTKKDLRIDFCSGQDFPKDLNKYVLIIHCGACTLNRKAMLARLNTAQQSGIAITNYGMTLSLFGSVIQKVLEPFPDALKAYNDKLKSDT